TVSVRILTKLVRKLPKLASEFVGLSSRSCRNTDKMARPFWQKTDKPTFRLNWRSAGTTAKIDLRIWQFTAMVMTINRQIRTANMAENRQGEVVNSDDVISTKRGFPVYRTNPSVPDRLPARPKRIQVPGGHGSMIVDGSTGEVLGKGGI